MVFPSAPNAANTAFSVAPTEINGKVKFGGTKRGVRKIHVEGIDGEERTYSIPYGKHVIVHEGDFVNAGTNLCEGAISPADILHVLGPTAVRDYLVKVYLAILHSKIYYKLYVF